MNIPLELLKVARDLVTSGKKPHWWNELHDEALANLDNKWKRLRQVTNRPEVLRDLASAGWVETKEFQPNKRQPSNVALLYRRK